MNAQIEFTETSFQLLHLLVLKEETSVLTDVEKDLYAALYYYLVEHNVEVPFGVEI